MLQACAYLTHVKDFLLGTGLEVTDGITTPQNEVVTDLIQYNNGERT